MAGAEISQQRGGLLSRLRLARDCASGRLAAVEVIDNAPVRLRLGVIENASSACLHPFITANVAPDSTFKTDGWSAYPGVPGFTHEPHVVGAMAAHIILPWVHRVISNLKTWGLGVYHGLRRKHLQAYLDKFVFRYNRRRTPHAAFRSLLAIGAAIKPVTYNMLIAPKATWRPHRAQRDVEKRARALKFGEWLIPVLLVRSTCCR